MQASDPRQEAVGQPAQQQIWFGSSAGVAIPDIFSRAKSVGGGWHVALA